MRPDSASCFDLLHDAAYAERRLAAALHTVASIQDYRKLLAGFQQLAPAACAGCSDLAATATDRAFEIELKGRLLLKDGLDTLNLLRDSGVFYQDLGKTAALLARMSPSDLTEMLRQESAQAQQKYGATAAGLFTEAIRATEQLALTFTVQEDQLIIKRKAGEFWIEEIALARQLKHVAATGSVVLGFVHSHAASTQLSDSDACALPGIQWTWLVVAAVEGTLLGQWHWREGPLWCSEMMTDEADS